MRGHEDQEHYGDWSWGQWGLGPSVAWGSLDVEEEPWDFCSSGLGVGIGEGPV